MTVYFMCVFFLKSIFTVQEEDAYFAEIFNDCDLLRATLEHRSCTAAFKTPADAGRKNSAGPRGKPKAHGALKKKYNAEQLDRAGRRP